MITKDMLMGDILETDKAEVVMEVLSEHGMHCFGCPSAQLETLEEACMVHDVDCDELLKRINA